VTTTTVHRLIERHAALNGAATAVADGDRALSYRELNYAANALARRLMARGFRRGAHATICMRSGIDLAVALLAVLKAGGSYTWRDPEQEEGPAPNGVSFSIGPERSEERHLHVDPSLVLTGPVANSPNLPVVTRGSDIACILHGVDGAPAVLVPHATIAALRTGRLDRSVPWTGDAGALDLWMALMAGTTAVLVEPPTAVAA